ncbi:MAG: AAA family ATPase [Actinobacteria bacterium]|nr:AAA family ATPase [Actinomycetota bacterium]
MSSSDPFPTSSADVEANRELAHGWKRLTRAATIVAVLMSPAVFVWLKQEVGWNWWESLLGTAGLVVALRGFSDLLFHRLLPRPSLFGLETPQLREQDVVSRRRRWFWRFWFRMLVFFGTLGMLLWLFFPFGTLLTMLPLLIMFPFYMIFNFLILFGPLLIMNLLQMKSFEPGDAQWGVKLDDVRGQAEAKEEIRRIVSIWQSGEQFERAGGKRERGVLFLGQPGTGKTMLAKAIATGFNSPFISMPGSGFAATFIGIDAIIVRILAARAKKLARKWGGQCIVFIDEIDAVGMRRQSLGQGAPGFDPVTNAAPLDRLDLHEHLFYGPWGALNPSGDLILETRDWRDRLFAARHTPTTGVNSFQMGLMRIYNFMFPGGMGMGSLALNQLLVVMDGIDNPPFFRKLSVNRINTFLDAVYIMPRRVAGRSLRLPPAKPRKEQIYFIGATNVPIGSLDPALTRPGRLGRHVSFRTPTKQDRLDILDLYLGKVAHDSALDTPKRRDEIARITGGYSPAMIEQVASMALTIAHHSGRRAFVWEDLVESITTLESGTAIGVEYIPQESKAIAVHEAGHAIAGHAYMKDFESTRLSIRRRGSSGGHHQAREKEERFSRFQSELFALIVWGLGAMAAERVFYHENSNGVGGDVHSATTDAALMVGAAAMGPQPFAVEPLEGETPDDARRRVLDRFERIGLQIMNRMRTSGGMAVDPIGAVLSDPTKRAIAAQVLGQAYFAAHNLVLFNRKAIERISDVLVERKEIFGDELMDLLEASSIAIPDVDLNDEAVWPDPMFSPMPRPNEPRAFLQGANGSAPQQH